MTAPLRNPAPPAGRLLGAGGEAEVYEVPGRPRLAFKRYKQPTPERTAKLQVMLAHPPEVDGGKAAIAWPVELVPGPGPAHEAAGFLMPRIDLATSVPLFRVYNPQSRQRVAPGFTWRYLLRTARNVAAIVDAVHRAGYVIGDLNESNLLVSNRALVSLVDCDSMQVQDPVTGDLHHCRVGKPEFTAPELHRVDLGGAERTEASDAFALAVLVFHLLMEGVHPFAGIWRGRGDPPEIAARIRRGRFPYRWGRTLVPPPLGLELVVLPPPVRRLVWRTFTGGMRRPARRPLAAEWLAALEEAEAGLTRCPRSPHHEHGGHLRRCPWCARIDAGMPDPFPGPTGISPLRPRPPSRLRRAWRLTRDRAATWRRATTAALWRGVRALPGRGWRGVRAALGWRPSADEVRRVSRAGAAAVLGVDVPAMLITVGVSAVAASVVSSAVVGVGRGGAVAPAVPGVALAAALTVAVAVAHAASQAVTAGRGRVRTTASTLRALPANLVAAARAAGVAAAVGAGCALAAALALVLAGGDHLGPRTVLACAGDLAPWGAALSTTLLVWWPRSRHPEWRADVTRLRHHLRSWLTGRRIPATWAAAAAAIAAAVVSTR